MNDLEHEIRDTLRRHEGDAPPFDPGDARDATSGARRRQIMNVAGVGVMTLAFAVGLVALGGLVRADRTPTVLDRPSPSPTPVTTPTPDDTEVVHGWPGGNPAPAGVYSWDAKGRDWMHNGTGEASGLGLEMTFSTISDVPQGEATTVTVAGYDAIHRQFPVDAEGKSREEWIVDIEGTVVSILLVAPADTPEAELAGAHAVVESIRSVPQAGNPGFILTFTLPYGWDVG